MRELIKLKYRRAKLSTSILNAMQHKNPSPKLLQAIKHGKKKVIILTRNIILITDNMARGGH